MKPDLYLKTVLIIIAIALGVMMCKLFISPDTVSAQGAQFDGVQALSTSNGTAFFDTRTGDLWGYKMANGGVYRVFRHKKISRLGQDGTWQSLRR